MKRYELTAKDEGSRLAAEGVADLPDHPDELNDEELDDVAGGDWAPTPPPPPPGSGP